MFRFRGGELELFLAHPGSPSGVAEPRDEWTIPKGGQKPYETLLEAAQREFEEEVGLAPRGPYLDLGSIQQNNGKRVHVWAFLGEWDDAKPIRMPRREVEWPPGSGRTQLVAEMDDARFFSPDEARRRLKPSQRPFVDRLVSLVNTGGCGSRSPGTSGSHARINSRSGGSETNEPPQ
jgi:predicted NUDIX family NTP pyrophosphohydrolase